MSGKTRPSMMPHIINDIEQANLIYKGECGKPLLSNTKMKAVIELCKDRMTRGVAKPLKRTEDGMISCPHCKGELLSYLLHSTNRIPFCFCPRCGGALKKDIIAESEHDECIYKTSDGYCAIHGYGVDVREYCVEGPCDDEEVRDDDKQ